MKLTSGFEDFGFGQTEEECIDDAIKNAYITREEIELGLARHEQTNVLGKGLYFSEEDLYGKLAT